MTLESLVRCNCFEKGLMKDCPVDIEDVYVGDDGQLHSHKLDNACERFDFRRFNARYDDLAAAFMFWKLDACEHSCGEIASERIPDGWRCEDFVSRIEIMGGEDRFPLLSTMLPAKECEVFPADKAEDALIEVDAFIESLLAFENHEEVEFELTVARRIRRLLVASIETGNPIWW